MKRSGAVLLFALAAALPAAQGERWADNFPVNSGDLSPTGANPYFILVPGYRLFLAGGATELVISVLDTTRIVSGVVTRVVEERETENGALKEVSRNYFVIHVRTRDVYYFGEDVDIYRDGQVVSHEGSWRAGERGAHFGLAMPGTPQVGARYYQEMAPGVAMDRARVVSLEASLALPSGTVTNLLQIEESTPLEPGTRETKLYARGIGLARDGELVLVRAERPRPNPNSQLRGVEGQREPR